MGIGEPSDAADMVLYLWSDESKHAESTTSSTARRRLMNTLGRVFLAIDLDANTRAALAAQLDEIWLPGKPSPLANWHVTLRWIGEIEEIRFDMLLAELDQADFGASFRVKIGGFGAFPNPTNANVLFRHVGDGEDRLLDLAAETETICREIGLEPSERPYVSHLTLSRLRPAADVGYLVDCDEEDLDLVPIRFAVDTVTAFASNFDGSDESSSRPPYEVLDTIELA